MKNLSLSQHLLMLSGIPLVALLIFAVLQAEHTYATWRNVEQIVALERLINAVEEYTHAVPEEAIRSLEAQETGSAAQKALVPAARTRTDAALADLRRQADAAGLVNPIAVAKLNGALAVDLTGNRARVDAGTESLAFILATMRPATLQAIGLVGRLAVLSTDAQISRLMLAYNAALWMNDAMLVERNVRPIAGPDGQLLALLGEAEGIAQQQMLIQQFEHLAPSEALPAWRRFLADPASQEIATLRRDVLGIGGGHPDPAGLDRWTGATTQRLRAMAPVLDVCSDGLRRAVADLEVGARTALGGYAGLVAVTFGLVLALAWRTRKELTQRICDLSKTMQCLAGGELGTEIPAIGRMDELGEMTCTLASFKASLIEREQLAVAQTAVTAALVDEKERLRVTLHAIGDGMIVTDSERHVTMMNDAAASLTGWRLADALGQEIDDVFTLIYADMPDADADVPWEPSSGHPIATDRDATLIRPDGTKREVDASTAPIYGPESGYIGSITVLHDVTESRMLLRRIRQLAHFDTLTGLPNRALFHDRLTQAVRLAERMGRRCALLFLDMDRFKHVNDTLGHVVGDLLLREVAQRLTLTVRESDTVARLGGDEFVVIVGALADTSAAACVADKILESIAQIDSIAGHDINVSFSIGIAIYPDDALDADALLMRADAAMYQAKDSGRNTSVFFDPDMDRVTQRRVQLRMRLAKALQLQQFALLYQPKIDLDSGRMTGAEALIRWHPESGEVVSPVDFIPIAEETGLILPIGQWVVTETCRQLRAWANQGRPMVPVSVNVSMKSLHSPAFLATLRAALEEYAVVPQAIELEITESTVMSNPEHVVAILSDIRALGIRISIDDFGTGFSSLSHLRRLPYDTIKVDRAFVHNMMESEDDAVLVRAIVGLATTLRKHVIAEGVETEAQRARLLQFGCREGQGFLFSKPVDAAVFAGLLGRVPTATRVKAET